MLVLRDPDRADRAEQQDRVRQVHEAVRSMLTGVKIPSGRPRPRTVEPRGDLSDIERSMVKMFEQVSPSIAQVAGRHGGGGLQMTDQATPAKPIEKDVTQPVAGAGYLDGRSAEI
jgi:hypothetical protein